jgi:hypothetical protein
MSQFQSVFISYGGPDTAFAERLHKALRRRGINAFIFSKDAVPGQRLHRLMRQGINEYDRVVLVCSRNSLDRAGVLNEIEETLEREAREGGLSLLLPITLDAYLFDEWNPGRPDVAQAVRARVAARFEGWRKNARSFRAAVDKLVTALENRSLEEHTHLPAELEEVLQLALELTEQGNSAGLRIAVKKLKAMERLPAYTSAISAFAVPLCEACGDTVGDVHASIERLLRSRKHTFLPCLIAGYPRGSPCSLAILSGTLRKDTALLFERITREETADSVRWRTAAAALAISNSTVWEKILLEIFEKGPLTVGVAVAMATLHTDRVNQLIAERLSEMPLRERQIILNAANEVQNVSFLPVVERLIEAGDLDEATWEYFDRHSWGKMHMTVREALEHPTREGVERLLEGMNARQVELCISDLRRHIDEVEDYFERASPDDWDDPKFGDTELEKLENLRTRYGWVVEYFADVARQGNRSRLSLKQIEQVTGTKAGRKRNV